jgi:hypothetical protein
MNDIINICTNIGRVLEKKWEPIKVLYHFSFWRSHLVIPYVKPCLQVFNCELKMGPLIKEKLNPYQDIKKE